MKILVRVLAYFSGKRSFRGQKLHKLNFKSDILEKSRKIAISKSLPKPFGSMYFNEVGTIIEWFFLSSTKIIRKDLLRCFWINCNPKFEKWKNTKNWPRYEAEAGKTSGFISDIPCHF